MKGFEDDVRGIHPCCLLVPDIRLRDFQGLVGSIAKLGLMEAIKCASRVSLILDRMRFAVTPKSTQLSAGPQPIQRQILRSGQDEMQH